MKKTAAILLIILMLACFAACGDAAAEKDGSPEPAAVAETDTPASEPAAVAETDTPVTEPAPEVKPEESVPEPVQPEVTEDAPVIGVDTSKMTVTDNISAFLADAATPIPAFTSTDMLDAPVTEAFFADYTLTMINFWEPWCGPCVGEMPDLQLLYTNYAHKGFTIMGVYSTPDDVAELLVDLGITYPIVQYVSEFDAFQTGYVPTTIFVNSKGEVISTPVAGSNSYEGWAEIVDYYLG